MALTTEELQQVENYLSGKGIHADEKAVAPLNEDKVLVLHSDNTGGYIPFNSFQAELTKGFSVVDGKLCITYNKEK